MRVFFGTFFGVYYKCDNYHVTCRDALHKGAIAENVNTYQTTWQLIPDDARTCRYCNG